MRKADVTPNKVFTPVCSKANTDRPGGGALEIAVPFNDAAGVRSSQRIILAVENGKVVLQEPVAVTA